MLLKNTSFVINLVLVAAVAVLYYLHFKGGHMSKPDEQKSGKDSSIVHVKFDPGHLKNSKIVFVNADTLYSNYVYVKDLRKESADRQSRLESTFTQKRDKLQQDYMDLQQKASQGKLSSDQAKVEDESLMKRKAELEGMQKQMTELADEMQKKNTVMEEKIHQYLKEYNKNSHYSYILSYSSLGGSMLLGTDSLDITREVLNGLNEQYKEGKK